jgi:hypothetical protein
MALMRRWYLLLSICLCLLLLRNSERELPHLSVPGPAPTLTELKLLSQIDRYASGYFYSLFLLHTGDLHGRQTSIDAYDFNHVLAWLTFLTTLNPQSEIAPLLATFYYSNTHFQNAIYRLILFLKNYATSDLPRRWRWYTYGIYLAHHHLKDIAYAYRLAVELSQTNNVTLPLWVKDMPGSLLIKMHHKELAKDFFLNLLKSSTNLSPEERHFLRYKLKSLND